MGYFASELEEETGVDGPLPPAGPPAASAIAAYEGGPSAYVGLVRWSAPTGSAEPDWVFGPSIPTRAWSMRHHDLPSGRYVRRFELQARVSELTMLGVQDPWIVAAMHPWSSDWYADSPLRPSPDTRRDRLIAAEESGDVHAFQRDHHFDLFCTDSAWKTAALEPERVARWAASGRLYPPPLPQDVGGRAKAEVPWRNPYFCIGLCGSCDEVKRLRSSLAAAADSAQTADLTAPEVIARALVRHPVADQLRALTRDGTLFAVHHATFMGKRTRWRLHDGFWLGEVPCTRALWAAVMGGEPGGRPELPQVHVSFEDAHAFFKALAHRDPELRFELPTEARWEYACRAGTWTATYAGDLVDDATAARVLDAIAWYAPNTDRRPEPVGLKAPNAWGLRDMLGNVWEWCGGAPRSDPEGAEVSEDMGSFRVLRGGAWGDVARHVRAADRDAFHPGDRLSDAGFRLSRGPLRGGAQ